ncbi:MAG: hypothetical protein ACJ8DU_04645 [Microvirga sp.]|jgi:hypothetical protein
MARPNVQEAMKARGITPVWDKPSEFDAYVKVFVERGTEVLKDLGRRPSPSRPQTLAPPCKSGGYVVMNLSRKPGDASGAASSPRSSGSADGVQCGTLSRPTKA